MSTAAAVTSPAVKTNGTHPPLPKPTPHATKFVPSQELELALIEPDPENPRKDFPKEEMQELISSVATWGIRQPIEVRPGGKKYRIVFGERRWRAAKAVGLEKVPVVIRSLTDLEASDVQMDENLKRADLSPLEIAGGYQRQLTLGRTMDEVCERAGKKRSAVYSAIALLKLVPEAKKAIGEQLLEAETAKLLVKYVPKSLQAEQVKVLTGHGQDTEPMSYREALPYLRGFVVDLTKAPWQLKQEGFKCTATSCAVCPSRAGNNPDLYDDVKPDTCVDRVAYEGKLHVFREVELSRKGVKLLTPAEAPVAEVFWNNSNALRHDSGFVEPKDTAEGDAKRRPYAELLEPEQLKKLTVVALDHRGEPRELLKRAGLEKELKRAGKFQTWEQATKQRAAKAESKSGKASEHNAALPSIDEMVDEAVVTKLVEVAEKKGPTPVLLRLIARELIGQCGGSDMFARRGLKDPGGGRPSEKEFEKTFGKLGPAALFGVVFEMVIDPRYMNGDGFDDVAAELGVDVKRVRAEVEAAQARPGGFCSHKYDGATCDQVVGHFGPHHYNAPVRARSEIRKAEKAEKAKPVAKAKPVKKAAVKKGGGKK